jgi:hypothetical protein
MDGSMICNFKILKELDFILLISERWLDIKIASSTYKARLIKFSKANLT